MDFLFNGDGFTEFRLVFIIMLAFLVLFFFVSLVPKKQNTSVTFFTVMMVSIIHITIAGALLITENMLLEEYGLAGDQLTFLLFIGVIVLSIINPIVYKLRNRNTRRSSYTFR